MSAPGRFLNGHRATASVARWLSGLLTASLFVSTSTQAQMATLVGREVLNPPSALLTSVMGIVVDTSGRVYVLDWSQKQVLVVSNGVVVNAIGRAGRGPGEFVTPISLGWHRDSLWIMDATLRRLSWFSGDGDYLGTTGSLEALPRNLVPGASPLPAGVLADGSLLLNFSTNSRSMVTLIPLLSWGLSGHLDTLLIYDRPITVQVTGPRGRMSRIPLPWSNRVLHDISADGGWYVSVDRSPTGTPQQRVTVTTSTVERGFPRVTRWAFEVSPVPVPREVRDSILNVHSLNTGVSRSGIARALPIPPTYPGATAVLATSDQTVWVRTEGPGRENSTWIVFTRAGRQVQSVVAPKGLDIMEVRGGFVYGVESDADGVPHLVRYRVSNAIPP